MSRVWRSQNPWRVYGLAEDDEKRLWFIEVNQRTMETHLKCYDQKKKGLVKGISLKQLVGDRLDRSKCRFLKFSKGVGLIITDLGLGKGPK